ncbi:PAS domain-containing protein [Rhodovibrionaceae bacterium A322]
MTGTSHPGLIDVYSYWQEKRGDRLAPARADIDPLDLPKLLPWLTILKVFRDPKTDELDFQATLVGTKVVQFMGRDVTNQHFGEIFKGPQAVVIKAAYDRVAREADVCYSQFDAGWMNKDYIFYERLLLPLSDDNKVVNRLMGCTIFHR